MVASGHDQTTDADQPRSIQPDGDWERSLLLVLADLGGNAPDHAPAEELIDALHGILAPLEPRTLDEALVERIEAIAAGRIADNATDGRALPPVATDSDTRYPAAESVSLWVGDIARLDIDVIVNAANKQLLGCRIPNHRCIDNAIHSAAGPRLRDDCATIIKMQQSLEPVGTAKLTNAYALPANYVAHTVGPQLVPGAVPTRVERDQLASCYRSCLNVAAEVDSVRTIAFCGISTGVFAFPQQPAAHIALTAIDEWAATNPGRFDKIVIDCFTEADAAVYRDLFEEWR